MTNFTKLSVDETGKLRGGFKLINGDDVALPNNKNKNTNCNNNGQYDENANCMCDNCGQLKPGTN